MIAEAKDRGPGTATSRCRPPSPGTGWAARRGPGQAVPGADRP